jgi:hypothetical protein
MTLLLSYSYSTILRITFQLHLLSVKRTAMYAFMNFKLPAMHLSPTILNILLALLALLSLFT